MSEYSSLLLYSVDHMGFRREEGQQKRGRAAARLFEKMCTVEIWRKLSGRRRLLTFNDLFDDKPVSNGHYLGLHTVPSLAPVFRFSRLASSQRRLSWRRQSDMTAGLPCCATGCGLDKSVSA